MKDSSEKVLDSRSIQIVMDVGAVLSITDSIRARVSDAEGNIASVVMTSRQILTRLTSVESSLQLALNDDSAELRIEDIEGRVNDIKIAVDGLKATLEDGSDYDDNWIRQRITTIEAGIDGLRVRLETMSESVYDDTWIVNKFHDFEVDIDGLTSSIHQIEVQGYDDTSIQEKYSELKNTVDGLSVRVGNIETGGDDQEWSESELGAIANRVYLRVSSNIGKSGIDVEANRITLSSANTAVVGSLNIEGDDSLFRFIDSKGNIGMTMGNANIPTLSEFTANNLTAFAEIRAVGSMTSGESRYFGIGRWAPGTITLTCTNLYAMYYLNSAAWRHGVNDTLTVTPVVYKVADNDVYTEVFRGSAQTTTFTAGDPADLIGSVSGSVSGESGTNDNYAIKFLWSRSAGSSDENEVHEFKFMLSYTTNIFSQHSYFGKNGYGTQWHQNGFVHCNNQAFTIQYSDNKRFWVDSNGTHIARPVTTPTSRDRLSIEARDYIITNNFNSELDMPTSVLSYSLPPYYWYEAGHTWRIFNFKTSDIYLKGAEGTPYRTMINGEVTEVPGTSAQGKNITIRAKHFYELIWDGSYVNIIEVG